MSIKGVGIDIIEVERISRACKRNEKFLSRVFTQKEIDYCMSKKNKFQHLSARFAAKEAFFKALGKRIRWKDVEIINQSTGKPEIKIHNPDVSFQRICVSLSHLDKYAVAIIVIE